MIWVQTNKTKLYRLIAAYIHLPKLKNTNFTEARDGSGYYLEWNVPNGTHYRACYLFANNSPRLVIQIREKQCELFANFMIRKLDVDDLVIRGMIRGVRSISQIRKYQLLQQQNDYNFLPDSYTAHSQSHEHYSATAI